jgi:mono/diheme cytochrome c family protein
MRLFRGFLAFLPVFLCASCNAPAAGERIVEESGDAVYQEASDVLYTESGEVLYQRYCASCHGENARGNGPVAPFIAVKVPDLTRIAERRSGHFPPEEIFQIIDGQSARAAHGPRHMPVWGYEFFGPQIDDRLAHQQATERVERLVSYLGTLQRTK